MTLNCNTTMSKKSEPIIFKNVCEIEFKSDNEISGNYDFNILKEISLTFDLTKEIEEFFFGKDPLQ